MKKLFAILLSFVMLLSLVACGGGASTERTEDPPKKDDPVKKEEPANSDSDTIKIGLYAPVTGSSAGSGQALIEGVQQAFGRVNAAGGINGKKLEIISYDCTNTSEGATKAATRLIEDDGVQVIIGSQSSPNVLAVSELTEKAKVLHIGNGVAASFTNIGLQYTFRGTANGDLTVKTVVDQVVDMGNKSIALISVETELGQSGRASVLECAEAAGLEVKADLTYQPTDSDFTGLIAKSVSAGADAIVLYGDATEVARMIKQYRQNGYTDVLYTNEGGSNSEMFSVAGDASEGLIFAGPYAIPATPEQATSPLMVDVLTEYYETHGEMPYTGVYFRGYDAGMLLAEALKNCDDLSSGEAIANAFRELHDIELLGGTFDFRNGSGDGLEAANKYMIMDGMIKAYDKEVLQAWRNK